MNKISSINGWLIDTLKLSEDVPYIGLHYDNNKDLIYALQMTTNPNLVSINPNNADIEVISGLQFDNGFEPETFDNTVLLADKGMYGFLASDYNNQYLCFVDINTGNTSEPLQIEGHFKGFSYLPDSNILYCLKRISESYDYSVGYVDINSAHFSLIKDKILFGQVTTFSSSIPNTAAIVEGSISHAFCIASALCDTSFNPSSKDKAPLATKAENSPKECPATISGLTCIIHAFFLCRN